MQTSLPQPSLQGDLSLDPWIWQVQREVSSAVCFLARTDQTMAGSLPCHLGHLFLLNLSQTAICMFLHLFQQSCDIISEYL